MSYDVISIIHGHYFVIENNNGTRASYESNCFELVSIYRDNKLKKLGI